MKTRLVAIQTLALVVLWAMLAQAAIPAYQPPVPTRSTLENGLQVVVFQDDRLPVARVQLLVPAGIAAQRADERGLAHFTAQMLNRGTTSRSAARFARDLEDIGSSFNASARRDFTLFDLGVLKSDLGQGMELLADAIVNPTFSADEIGRMRYDISRTLIELHLNVVNTAEEQIWPLALGSHPYGHTPAGEVPSVVTLGRDQLVSFHDRYYKPTGSVLLVAGDVSVEDVMQAARNAFGTWSGKAVTVPFVPIAPTQKPGGIRIVDLPSRDRTEIRVALPAPEHGATDYMAFAVLDRLLGKGTESRLANTPVAGALGQARSSYTALRDGGLLIISAPVRTDSAGAAVAALKDAIEGLRRRPPAPAELEGVVRLMRRTQPFSMETLGGLLTEWSTGNHYGLASEVQSMFAEQIQAVNVGDVVRLAAERLNWEQAVVLAVGPASALRPQLETFGSVEVVQLNDMPQAAWASTIPTEEDFARGRAVAAQAIAAHGGLDAINAVQSSSVDATIAMNMEGQEAEGRLRQARQDPYRLRELLEVFVYGSEQVLDGDRGWVYETAAGRVEVADSVQVATMRANFESDAVHLLRLLSADGTQIAHRGVEIVGGRPAELLQVLSKGSTRWMLFDAETHLLVAVDVRGGVPPQILARRVFSDYREVEGFMWPYQEERYNGSTLAMRIKAQTVAVNITFAEGLFGAPEVRR